MELAEPSIAAGFDDLVQRGAKFVIAFPYFLSPGRHWKHDVPALVAKAAESHPEIKYVVTAPLGLHPLMIEIMTARIATCLQQPENGCDVCHGDRACQIIAPRNQ
jgi:sirohydrochlorin ferrochelatase